MVEPANVSSMQNQDLVHEDPEKTTYEKSYVADVGVTQTLVGPVSVGAALQQAAYTREDLTTREFAHTRDRSLRLCVTGSNRT